MAPGALPPAASGVDTGELLPGNNVARSFEVPQGTKVPHMVPEGSQVTGPGAVPPTNFAMLNKLNLMMPTSNLTTTPVKSKRAPESWSPVKATRCSPMESLEVVPTSAASPDLSERVAIQQKNDEAASSTEEEWHGEGPSPRCVTLT